MLRWERSLVCLSLLVGCSSDEPELSDRDDCPEGATNEPPCSDGLADSPWPASHRGNYAQGSSPLRGPTEVGSAEHIDTAGVPITLAYSPEYEDGKRVIWLSPLGSTGAIIKLDEDTLEELDRYVPAEREESPPIIALGVSGAYNLVDAEGRFHVARDRAVEVYVDESPGERTSRIALARRFTLPDSVFCGDDDVVVGMTMALDGSLAIVTQNGSVATLPRDPDAMAEDAIAAVRLNEAVCDQADKDELEGFHTVSNSIAADEEGGIYAVTSEAMVRLDWDGAQLSVAWEATYETGDTGSGIRLGAGSGSTPSLMGTGLDDDRFVVITDARPLMHLVFMYRDEIPPDWAGLSPVHDRRIACEVPITFGDPDATESVSEQSVLVRGYGAVVVNNQLADESVLEGEEGAIANILSALEGGDPAQAPTGAQRVDWDAATRACSTVWTNSTVSLPNTIPTMSDATGLMYAVGLRGTQWGLEALRWDDGTSAFFTPALNDCGEGWLEEIGPVFGAGLAPWFERMPNSCENATYAATQVGPDGQVVVGTFYGVTRYR